MAANTKNTGARADIESGALDAAQERAFSVFGKPKGDLEFFRKRLADAMWDDVGIIRSAESLARGRAVLEDLSSEIGTCGVANSDRRYNLTWMDRLNLENLILVSTAIAAAAQARLDSRGAHFRVEHPHSSALASSTYTVVRLRDGDAHVGMESVIFSHVRPGQTLVRGAS